MGRGAQAFSRLLFQAAEGRLWSWASHLQFPQSVWLCRLFGQAAFTAWKHASMLVGTSGGGATKLLREELYLPR